MDHLINQENSRPTLGRRNGKLGVDPAPASSRAVLGEISQNVSRRNQPTRGSKPQVCINSIFFHLSTL